MYHEKFVAAIKVDGKILKEFKDTVFIPFGKEYSILLKNLNSVKAIATVSIDGTDALSTLFVMIEPYGSIELERFVNQENLESGNKFKFIERTSKIENHRGIKVEDGLIRIEFQFENKLTHLHYNPNIWCQTPYIINGAPYYPAAAGTAAPCPIEYKTHSWGSAPISGSFTGPNLNVMPCSYSVNTAENTVANTTGITVQGSESNQTFKMAPAINVTEEKHVMILRLQGQLQESGEQVTQAITVKSRAPCKICGTKNKSGSKFCCECGTAITQS